jgi:rod shape-determining protein MreC
LFALIRKYREVLLLLALVAAAALTVFAHAKAPNDQVSVLSPLRAEVLKVEAPVERGLNRGAGAVIDAWKGYVALRSVRAENQALRQRLLHAEGDLASEIEITKENERLRELLRFSESSTLSTLAAPVVGDTLAVAHVIRGLRIGAGQTAGLHRGMPVLAAKGVVGRVSQVFARSADVQLIIDPASAVAVRDERSRARANVAGQGDDTRAKLEYALRTDDIEDGDLLVTSGTDGVFPAGLAVGKVVSLRRKASGNFLEAQVAPVVDPREVEEVLVVTGQKESLESTPAAEK